MTIAYPNTQLFIDGAWCAAASGRTLPVMNPATGKQIGTLAHAEQPDLDRALEAASKGFHTWRKISAFGDAGVPAGVVNLVDGVPAHISTYLLPHPVIRKISFPGSTVVGKQLAAMAGAHMKRMTMELGGHAPVIVFDDADIDVAAKMMVGSKFRNAGQVCVSPTRFLVQEGVYNKFVDKFVDATKALKVGNGLEPSSTMGSLANPRRSSAMEMNVEDAAKHGGKVRTGGHRIGKEGNL